MTTQREIDIVLRHFFDEGPEQVADRVIDSALVAIAQTEQRRVQRTPWSFPHMKLFPVLATAAAICVLLVGGLAYFSKREPLPIGGTPSPGQSARATERAVVAPSPSGPQATPSIALPRSPLPTGQLIAYTRQVDKPNTRLGSGDGATCISSEPVCHVSRVWLVGVDGTGAHELFPGGVHEQEVLDWSPDGNHLLYFDNRTMYVVDSTGGDPQLVNTGCSQTCYSDSYPKFSSDGSHLVFVRSLNDGSYRIATMDLRSGQVAEITSTTMRREIVWPAWAPDGKHITFARPGDKVTGNGPIAPVQGALFQVDADGQNLHQIDLGGLAGDSASWSPDGSRLVFTSSDALATDVYTSRSDGSDIQRLTSDGVSVAPSWTSDGRIVFAQRHEGAGPDFQSTFVFWTMDSAGANATELIPSDVTQAASGPFWRPEHRPALESPHWNASSSTPVGPPAPTPLATPTPQLAAGFSWTGSLHGSPWSGGVDTATVLQDGHVLITKKCDQAADVYDPQTGTFSLTGPMTSQRSSASATLLQDGRVLIAGSSPCSDAAGILASAEIYDPVSGTFTATASMHADRFAHTATLLNDGHVLIAGGVSDQVPTATGAVVLASYHEGLVADSAAGSTLAAAELYDPGTGTFTPTGSMADFRSNFSATLLPDGRVLVAGGGGGYTQASAELYDPAAGAFSPTGSMVKPRWLHTATLLEDGRVLVTGGRSPNDAVYASAELYDPTSGSFTLTGSMSGSRQQHTATLLADGRVLVAGGYTSDAKGNWNVLASTEIYDPGAGTFASTGSMGDAREGAVAALLHDGRVLIAGGTGIGTAELIQLTSAVIYQP